MLPQVVEIHPDGLVGYRQRYQGRFSSLMIVAEFPFDNQECVIRFTTLDYTDAEIEFENTMFRPITGMTQNPLVADWKVGPWSVHPDNYQPTPISPNRVGFVFRFGVERYSVYHIVKVLLPIIFVVCMSWVVFWIDPVHVGSQTGVAVTSMLTLIAYRFSFDGQLPRVGYLTRMDSFMLGSTILVLLSLVEVAVTNNLSMLNRRSTAVTVDRWCRAVFAALLVATMWL